MVLYGLKGQQKNVPENIICFSCLLHIFADNVDPDQTAQIRLLLQVQSNLVLDCLSEMLLKHFSRRKKEWHTLLTCRESFQDFS